MHTLDNYKFKNTIKVRVYVLIRHDLTSSSWEEVGTGSISFISDFTFDNQKDEQYLVITPSPNAKLGQLALKINKGKHSNYILYSKLDKKNLYEKQEPTIISWEDKILNYQFALSFMEKQQCNDYWKLICSKIGKNYNQIGNISPQDILENPNSSNLPLILTKVKTRQDLLTYHIINKTQFMPNLKEVVNLMDEDNKKDFQILIKIMKGIIGYNDTRILQVFFSNNYFQILLKIIRYSQQYRQKTNFAQIYRQKQPFSNIINLPSNFQEKIIIQNNIAFYRDFLLQKKSQSVLQTFLNQIYNQNNYQIVGYLSKSTKMKQVAEMLETNFCKIINFLYELISVLKQFQEELRYGIVDTIYQSNLLQKLVQCLYNNMINLSQRRNLIFEVIGIIGLYGQKMYLDFLKKYLNTNVCLIKMLVKYFCEEGKQIKNIITYFIKQSIFLSHVNNKFEWMQFINLNFNNEIGLYLNKNKENLSQKDKLTFCCFIDYTLMIVEQLTDHRILRVYIQNSLIELGIRTLINKKQQILLLKLFKVFINKQQNNNKAIQKNAKQQQLVQYVVKSKIICRFMTILNKTYTKNNILTSVALQILTIIHTKKIYPLIKQIQKQTQLPKLPILQNILQLCKNQQKDQIIQQEYRKQQLSIVLRKKIKNEVTLLELQNITKQIGENNIIVQSQKKQQISKQTFNMRFDLGFVEQMSKKIKEQNIQQQEGGKRLKQIN